jgi:AcrR family transcriptional regulator
MATACQEQCSRLVASISEVLLMAPGKASASVTARQRARASLTADIKEEARSQLAAVGADALSLRAVARELGLVSSALYRYFPSKDDLLTALIIDAYDAVGEVAETAVHAAGPRPPRARWLAACHAIRAWALAHPHEYALIYGSPVPGYRAPEATIGPASRVPLALISVLGEVPAGDSADPFSTGETGRKPDGGPAAAGGGEGAGGGGEGAGGKGSSVLAGQAAAVTAALGLSVRPEVLLRGVLAWTQLFGMISFELFGQFARTFEPADELFEYAVVRMAQLVGLLVMRLDSGRNAEVSARYGSTC